jgi:RHS repeat-associated protein
VGRGDAAALSFDRLKTSFGARYYDSAAGVWLTQDIYRGEPRQPLTLHRTLYVLANPVNYVDAYGYNAIRPVPNGYGGVGGGSEPVRTTNPTVPNATNPQNAPYHFELTGRDDLYFNDFHSVDSYVPAAAAPTESFTDAPWSCHGSFCLVESDYYGPSPYNKHRNDLLALWMTDMSASADISALRSRVGAGCWTDACWELAEQLQEQYGWEVSGWRFNHEELQNFWDAAQLIEAWFERNGGGDARGRMQETFGGTSFFHQEQTPLIEIIESSAILREGWGPAPIFGFADMKDRSHVLGSSVYLNMADPQYCGNHHT